MRTLLSKLSISQRIMLGFLLMLSICIALAGFTMSGMQQLHGKFSQFKSVSEDTNLMLEIDKDISELQRYILVFHNTNNATGVSELLNTYEHLKVDIDSLSAKSRLMTHATSADYLQKILGSIQKFKENIESLQTQQTYREEANKKLAANYVRINILLSKAISQAEHEKHIHHLDSLWQIQLMVAQAEMLGVRYFEQHELQHKQNVMDTLGTTQARIQTLSQQMASPIYTLLLQNLLQVKQTFHKTVQADRNYLFLVNVVIAGESSELGALASQLKMDYLDEQRQLFEQSERDIRFNQTILWLAALFASLFAVSAAVFIGRRISGPLQQITRTFGYLVQGESTLQIPGVNRADEIGQLAKAASVFASTNQRTQVLLEQAKDTAIELKNREHALEAAVSKAQEASLAKSQFLANMSHELRTPMNAILGMLTLLQKTQLDTRQADYAIKTEGAARSLLGLLNDILDVSKAEAGKIELEITSFNLDILLRDLAVILSPILSNKPVNLQIQIAPDIPKFLQGDAMRLQQVLINLGSNAIKFTTLGEVVIHVQKTSGNALKFSVSDTGIGIAPENKEKIFSDFSQAEASTTRRFGGTGLGLAISKRLVQLMGGELSLESTLGCGSQFYFTLPLAPMNPAQIEQFQQAQNRQAPSTEEARLRGLRILLVEDNLTNQQIACELLEAEGALITLALHGKEAVDLLQSQQNAHGKIQFDAVLMDMQMPVMDGLMATQIIRQHLLLNELPIIAMTANARLQDREACLAAGMNDHIGKPFDLNHLVQLIRKQTGKLIQTETETETETLRTEQPTELSSAYILAMQWGIELELAVQRMGGKRELYLRLLPKFYQNVQDINDALLASLQIYDLPQIARHLHSLKGVAATMGLAALSAAAAELEAHCKIGIHAPALNAQLTHLSSDLKLAVERLKIIESALKESKNKG